MTCPWGTSLNRRNRYQRTTTTTINMTMSGTSQRRRLMASRS